MDSLNIFFLLFSSTITPNLHLPSFFSTLNYFLFLNLVPTGKSDHRSFQCFVVPPC